MNSNWLRTVCNLAVIISVFLLIGTAASFAQDPQLPFTWKGDGTAWILGKEGIEEIAFKVKFRIAEDGTIAGEFFTEENKAVIERMYFTADTEGVRRVYLVLSFGNEEKSLGLLSLRVLKGSFGYGEIQAKKLEKDGEIEKGLELGNKSVQEIYEDYLPSSVDKALKKFRPVGFLKITGGMSSE